MKKCSQMFLRILLGLKKLKFVSNKTETTLNDIADLMYTIKFLPIQQGKHYLSVSFCSYHPLTLHPQSDSPEWPQSLRTGTGCFESHCLSQRCQFCSVLFLTEKKVIEETTLG